MSKVNLQIAGKAPRSGYLNIDPLADDNKLVTQGSVTNLDEHIDDAECEELIASDVLDFLPSNEIDEVISHWVKKLRRGGSIVVGGIDIREVSRAYINQELTLEDVNQLLHGAQTAPYDYRKSTLTLQKLVEVFQAHKLKIVSKRVVNYYYSIKAERPESE